MSLNLFYNFFAKIFEEISELRSYDGDIVDISNGRMTPEEVKKVVLPIAKEKGWIGESEQVIFYAEEPCLFHYTRRQQLVWIANFSFKTAEMKDSELSYLDNSFAVIKVDDATGDVLEARGRR